MSYRIAFTGASGTGKTVICQYLTETRGVPINPVGSRSVSAAMGFASPYDVDAAGKRAEFQHRLVEEKRAWEDAHEDFVTDRTTLDNLVYTILHDVKCIDSGLLESVVAGLDRYTHIVHFPVDVFCKTDNDPARVPDMTYHTLYDTTLQGFLRQYAGRNVLQCPFGDLDQRKQWIDSVLTVEDPTMVWTPWFRN